MERSCELGWQRSMALDLGMCGLSAKCPDRFMCLNTWFPDGGTVWKGCGTLRKWVTGVLQP